MKYLKYIFLLSFLILALSACNKNTSKTNTLRVGIDLKYPPFMYLDDNDIPTGLEPDLARAFGEYLNSKVEIVNTDFSMLIPALDSGDIDIIISDMAINDDRIKKVDFSKGYRYSTTPALVNKDFYETNNISDNMSVEDFFALSDLNVIGLSGTIGVSLPENYGITVTEVPEIASALMEITSGSSNVLIGSYVVFGDHAANIDTTKLYLNIPFYSTSCFQVRKGNTELLEKANLFIDTLYAKNGLYESLATKYSSIVKEVYKNESCDFNYIINKPTYN